MSIQTGPRLLGGHVLPAPASGLVDVVSASFGAGHDAAAHELTRLLQSNGFETRTWDIVDLLPGHAGRMLRAAYVRQVDTVPSSWAWLFRTLQQRESLAILVRSALQPLGTALMERVESGSVAVVSTHPFASQALGQLRASGRLRVPVVTYLTDMSVHRLWVHRCVDLHLALHELPANAARRLGAADTRIVRPAVPDAFLDMRFSPLSQAERRLLLGLPIGVPLVLVTGGAYGIGKLSKAADDIQATGLATAVVLCGRNDRLHRRIRLKGSAIALGWVDDMPLLLGAVDAVVQNAGGITSLESLAAGVPILTYRCLPGHGEANAAALDKANLVPWVRDRTQLPGAVWEAFSQRPSCARSASLWAQRADLVGALRAQLADSTA